MQTMIDEKTVKELARQRSEPEWLAQKRLQALAQFESLPETRVVYGPGLLVDVSELDVGAIDPLQATEEVHVIAPDNVDIMTFQEALESTAHANLLSHHLLSTVSIDRNRFTALHAAAFNNGIIIRIPEKTAVSDLIRIRLTASAKARLDWIIVIAGKQSSAHIIEDVTSEEEAAFHSKIVEVIADDGACIEYTMIHESRDSLWDFGKKGARVASNARVVWSDCVLGGRFSQILTETTLDGQGASSATQGVFFGNDGQHFDIRCASRHRAANTSASMATRTVLDGSAKAVYRGLIRIEKEANQADSHQHSDTLLLGDASRADAVPELEIENDDVKCSHGATIGQIDLDKLFYMMSRGIDERTAKKQVIKGFFKPILDTIKDEQLRVNLDMSINRRLEVNA